MNAVEPLLNARNTNPPTPIPTRAERIELGRSESQVDLDVAHEVATSDMLPAAYKGKSVQVARANLIVVFGLGRALGIDRIAALYGFHVIENTPSPSAKLQASLVRRAGHKLRVVERSSTRAVCMIQRHDDPDYPTTVEYTIDDARNAGYLDVWVDRWIKNSEGRNKRESWTFPTGLAINATAADLQAAGAPDWVLKAPQGDRKRKDNWHTNTRSMLWHRAVTEAVGAACPEVTAGLDFEPTDHQFGPVIDVSPSGPDPVDVLKPQPVADDPDDGIDDAELVDDEPAPSEVEQPEAPDPEPSDQGETPSSEVEKPAPSVDETMLREAIKASPHSMAAVMRQFEAKAIGDLLTDQNTIDRVMAYLEGGD